MVSRVTTMILGFISQNNHIITVLIISQNFLKKSIYIRALLFGYTPKFPFYIHTCIKPGLFRFSLLKLLAFRYNDLLHIQLIVH